MRNLMREFFYSPKHEKVRDNVMLTRLVTTVITVIICLAAMGIMAYAYFSCTITSGPSFIKAATFATDVTVQVTDENGVAVADSNITPISGDHKKYALRGLEVGKWYMITIKPLESLNTAKTGFIIVSSQDCETTYHTQQLGVDKNVPGEYTDAITFKLMITDNTEVILESHWGTSSYYPDYQISSEDDERYITVGAEIEEVKMIINGFTEPNVSASSMEDIGETETNSDTEQIPASEQ